MNTDNRISQFNAMRDKWKIRGLIYLAANDLKTEQEIYRLLNLEEI